MGHDVVVIGDINIDLLLYTERHPLKGQVVQAQRIETHFGGVGGNIAVALSRLGLDVALVGSVGRETWGDRALRNLREEGVNLELISRQDKNTGLWAVLVDASGERTMIGDRGANVYHEWSNSTEDVVLNSRAIHISGYTFLEQGQARLSKTALELGGDVGATTIVDLDGFAQRDGDEIVSRIDHLVQYLLMNEEEGRLAVGSLSKRKLLEFQEAIGASALVVKRGALGSLACNDGTTTMIESFGVRAVDTTGAGDAFDAGFIFAILRGLSVEDSCVMGNALAAFKCQGRGPRHLPRLPELVDTWPVLRGMLRF
ncbi:MAG: carbohydrate kinase family protein [Candidatus Geothermarchaeales archaeon]